MSLFKDFPQGNCFSTFVSGFKYTCATGKHNPANTEEENKIILCWRIILNFIRLCLKNKMCIFLFHYNVSVYAMFCVVKRNKIWEKRSATSEPAYTVLNEPNGAIAEWECYRVPCVFWKIYPYYSVFGGLLLLYLIFLFLKNGRGLGWIPFSKLLSKFPILALFFIPIKFSVLSIHLYSCAYNLAFFVFIISKAFSTISSLFWFVDWGGIFTSEILLPNVERLYGLNDFDSICFWTISKPRKSKQ